MDPLEQPLNIDPRLQRELHSTGDLTKHPDIDLATQVTIRLPGAGTMVFNRYRLQRVLGRGGMGVVWLAEDTKLNREVALKFLPDVVGADAAAMQELMDETRRGLDLAHPNIVRIYDLVTDDTAAAISMEFVDGRNLSERRLTMPHGIFTVEEAKPWLGHLCSALDYAHLQKRLVHRDLKPANLMLDKQGELKIADFGIARNVSDAVSRLSVSVNAGTSGTLPYMSPQQAMGDQPRPTDDMYSLGATLFELFTGKPPFYSGDITAQVTSKRAPTIRQRREELFLRGADAVPEDWEEAIAACLDKDPAKRPQTAGELARRLGVSQVYSASPAPSAASKKDSSKKTASKPAPVAWKEVKTQSTPPGAKKPKSVLAIVLVSVALLVLLVGGAGAGALWWWFHRPVQVVEAEQRAHFDLGVVGHNTDSKTANVGTDRNVAAPQVVTSEKPTPAMASGALPSAGANTEPSGSIPLAQSSLPGGALPADPLPPASGSTPSANRTIAMPSPIQAPSANASAPTSELATAGPPTPQVSISVAPSQPTIPSAEPQATPTTPTMSPGAPAPTAPISTSNRAALLTGGSVDGSEAGHDTRVFHDIGHSNTAARAASDRRDRNHSGGSWNTRTTRDWGDRSASTPARGAATRRRLLESRRDPGEFGIRQLFRAGTPLSRLPGATGHEAGR